MDRTQTAKLITIFLILSIAFSGHVITSSRADLAGADGQVAISSLVTIRQGNGVNYSFAENETLTRLEVRQDSIVLNSWFELYGSVSSGSLVNVIYEVDGDYVKWLADPIDESARMSFTLSGMPNYVYEVYKDGTLLAVKGGPTVRVSSIGNGTFEVTASMTSVWMGIAITISLGLALLAIGIHQKNPIYLLLSGLIWLIGGILVFTAINTAWTILLIGLGVIILFQGGLEFAKKA